MRRFAQKILILTAAFACAFLFAGCYTRLMMYDGETLTSGTGSKGAPVNDCIDCREPVTEAANSRREVCVWERDILGFPELRCYSTNYSSSWVYFHNTPWWYRNVYGWHDTRGCPPYYYYDRVMGICRYYEASRPPSSGGGSGGGSADGRSSAPSRNIHSVPRPAEPAPADAATLPPPMFPGSGAKQLSPATGPVSSPVPSTPPSQGSGQPLAKPQDGAQGKAPPQSGDGHSRNQPPSRNIRSVPSSGEKAPEEAAPAGGDSHRPAEERGDREERGTRDEHNHQRSPRGM